MVLKPRSIRLQAMKALVEKGVLPQELGNLLQRLVSEDGDVDSELIQLLLQHKAPVDGVGDDANNVVLVAARRGHLSILRMLCDARPQNETLSKAVPVAFSVIDTCGYNVTLDTIKLLLQNAAVGLPTHQTLLAAVERDSQLDIVRLLFEHGADANYASGASFGVALRTSNFKLLQILCKLCPPNHESITSKFFMAIDPRYYNSEALELLLSSTRDADATLNTLWSSEKLEGNPNITTIVPSLIRHGLNVDIGNGYLLSFAIRENNIILLDRVLSTNPSKTSLTIAFHTATNAQSRSLQLETMGLLLEKAKSAEIGQSISLLQQTHCALSGDFEGLLLLLRHKAVASPSAFTKACLATASSTISWNEKQQIFECLLAASAKLLTKDMSQLLADSVTSLPECTQLPQLLLTHGAEVEFETLEAALENSSLELLDMLVSSIKSADIVVRTLKHVQKTTMVLNKRYQIYEHLLGKGIPSDDVSELFLDLLRASDLGDLSILKLLENGASPGYQNCKAFSLALHANNLVAVRLLIQYLVDDSMATVAFDIVRKSPLLNKSERVMIYRPFLEWNISKTSISQVLVDSLKDGHLDLPFLRLLLAKGADPNMDNGHCFAVTSKAGAVAEFRALSKYAKPEVIKVVLNNFHNEREVIRWFKVCLEEQPQLGMIDQDELVFQCMRKFPGGADLLKLLLDQGAPASAKIDYSLCAGWKPEPCTALIWALFSKPRIEDNVILVLLSRGDAALPAYSTPLTKVSAAFGCLLDKTRISILSTLLNLDRDRILDYEIPGTSFGPLSVNQWELKTYSGLLGAADELPLLEASLYLGNFKAFRLITRDVTPNDGTLHLAALLSLPKFVEWLLKKHDPNHRAEEFDNMVPLACVCASKPQPWCKIANEESGWKIRQYKTMRLLAPITSPKWRHRNMTILHWAMENGPDTAQSMIKALDILHDPEKNEKYLYMDRDGIEYSPQQYVKRVLDTDKKEKDALFASLEGAKFQSRYFKRILPDKGDQPTGFHGLPKDLLPHWRDHDSAQPDTEWAWGLG